MDGSGAESMLEGVNASASQLKPEEIETKARVDAVWQKMNKGVSTKTLKSILGNPSSMAKKSPSKNPEKKSSTALMAYLGLGPRNAPSPGPGVPEKHPGMKSNGCSEEAKKLAAAALSAVKDAAAAATTGRGKIEITEVRDFAGEEIEVKKLVDAGTGSSLKGNGAASAVDAVLEQIKKKQKLSVLDKTKKDWGEYKDKDENKGIEDELDAYKKSSNQYLDKVSFLQRTDYREFERERDARLALQAKRKQPDSMHGDFGG